MPSYLASRQAFAGAMAALARYHDGSRTMKDAARLSADVQLVGEVLGTADMDDEAARDRFIEAVRVGLLLRYSDEEATQLFHEFVAAFPGASGPMLREA